MWIAAGVACLIVAAICFARIVRNARADLSLATARELMILHVGTYLLFFVSLVIGAWLLGWPGY